MPLQDGSGNVGRHCVATRVRSKSSSTSCQSSSHFFRSAADKRDSARNSALFRECLDIVIKAWTEDPFAYEGEFYRFPVPGWKETNKMFEPFDGRYHAPDGEYVGMYVHPRPLQQPRALLHGTGRVAG